MDFKWQALHFKYGTRASLKKMEQWHGQIKNNYARQLE